MRWSLVVPCAMVSASRVTMRSNLYFGTTNLEPESEALSTGLMWFTNSNVTDASQLNIRHACSEGDGLEGWGWVHNNGIDYGKQRLPDVKGGVNLTTSFFQNGVGSPSGWSLRVEGTSTSASPLERHTPVTVLFYVSSAWKENYDISDTWAKEKGGEKRRRQEGVAGDTFIRGKRFTIAIPGRERGPGDDAIQNALSHMTEVNFRETEKVPLSPFITNTQFTGLNVPSEETWKIADYIKPVLEQSFKKANAIREEAMDFVAENMEDRMPDTYPEYIKSILAAPVTVALNNHISRNSNVFIIQRTVTVPFTLDIAFISRDQGAPKSSSMSMEDIAVNGKLNSELSMKEGEFHRNISTLLGSKVSSVPPETLSTVQFAISNLLGGLTFFRGSTVVKGSSRDGNIPQYTLPGELYSSVPSRSFFPRGFFWDEGFHQLLAVRWDYTITMKVLTSWLNRMNDDGWIEREQILGDESRSRVPPQFQVQDPTIANPPVLILPFQYLIRMRNQIMGGSAEVSSSGGSSKEVDDKVVEISEFLRFALMKFKKHYDWFKVSQSGNPSVPFTFRWRGRTNDHCLASGLDDYPRTPNPVPTESHVDAVAWMTWYSQRLADLAAAVGESDLAEEFLQDHDSCMRTLSGYHWDESARSYGDIGITAFNGQGRPVKMGVAPRIGYITILPLLLELEDPSSERVGHMLLQMSSTDHLFSKYGLRSLSISDKDFGQKENYWRGAIWMNMNYLALRALKNKYSVIPSPFQKQAQELYQNLRSAVIDNVVHQYKVTGFIWESYDSSTGKGRGCKPFTGWSALIALIVAEDFS